MAISLEVNGCDVSVPEDHLGSSLLEVLRDVAGVISAKDGCAPQGQCGCCTVLVDGKARVACVTPVRRVAGRSVTTLEGLETQRALDWADAFIDHGATQCGFCTPGIIMRLEDRRLRSELPPEGARRAVDRMLAAHLCRCTGWQGIADTAVEVLGRDRNDAARQNDAAQQKDPGTDERPALPDPAAAAVRAQLEGGTGQRIDRSIVAAGAGGFATDTVPDDALVAVPDGAGGWVVEETLTAARQVAGRVQGRRSTIGVHPPLEVPEGVWDAQLATSWVEPAYLETDASWCEPGGEPASAVANGGAFGGKSRSPLESIARELADEHQRTVLVRWSREDTVRNGPKRPPLAVGVRGDGTGAVRVARTTGIAEAIAIAAPGVSVDLVDLAGPPTTTAVRAAGWAEVFCALVAAGHRGPLGGRDGAGVRVDLPSGAWARTELRGEDTGGSPRQISEAQISEAQVSGAQISEVQLSEPHVEVTVGAGDPVDSVVLRSYVIGAVHMAAGMVCSEGLSVDPEGNVADLTIRSFGILPASAMPRVRVVLDPEGSRGEPRAVSEAVFAATAAAVWAHHGFAPRWPIGAPVIS